MRLLRWGLTAKFECLPVETGRAANRQLVRAPRAAGGIRWEKDFRWQFDSLSLRIWSAAS
jgi:hypothetical protein